MNGVAQPPEGTVSVSALTKRIAAVLERNVGTVSVTGELSNVLRHTSGHVYFTLKDPDAQLAAVMFRGIAQRIFFRPQNGMEVVCTGTIGVYQPRGQYQLVVTDMQPRGEGALQAAFEALKRTLHAEGLFDQARKKRLPAYPRTIALVTSPTGAAIRDLVSVIRRRDPSVQLLLLPVQVQGAGAADDIARAIDLCNEYGAIDLIIAGRGGGSMEDLWAFNEEVVARAVARSGIPVISAVGHEIDYTIADFVADLRAATPSVAGEIAAPSRDVLLEQLRTISTRLWKSVDFQLSRFRLRLAGAARSRALSTPLDRLHAYEQRVDAAGAATHKAMIQRMTRYSGQLELFRHRVLAHDPLRILRKGYAIVSKGGVPVARAEDVRGGDALAVRFQDGTAVAVVQEVEG